MEKLRHALLTIACTLVRMQRLEITGLFTVLLLEFVCTWKS